MYYFCVLFSFYMVCLVKKQSRRLPLLNFLNDISDFYSQCISYLARYIPIFLLFYFGIFTIMLI